MMNFPKGLQIILFVTLSNEGHDIITGKAKTRTQKIM